MREEWSLERRAPTWRELRALSSPSPCRKDGWLRYWVTRIDSYRGSRSIALYAPLREKADREIAPTLKVAVLKAAGSNTTEVLAATGASRREVNDAMARLRRVAARARDSRAAPDE